MPPSNRNRPASINGIALTYDANGNLTQKGDRRFHYDYRNRLARVTDVTSGAEVAAYTYDAFNRRVAKTVNGETTEIAWSGWRNLEEYVPDGVGGTQISSRRTFGGGLDEVVRQETDLDGDGTLELASLPIYDSSGNLAAMTDGTGKVVERYLYEPYGGRTIYADVTPPVVEQIRTESGALVLELSEPVREEPLSDPGLVLTVDGTGEEIALTASQPVTEGRFAGQRVVLTPASVPGAGEAVTLTVPAAALKDSFDNAAGADTVVPFTWPTADAIIEDASAPQLARIAYKEGKLELLWDESIAPASAGTAITLNGQPTSWSAAADGYTLHGVDSIPNGRHTLAIGTGPLDLAGNGVLSAYALEFEKVSSATACNGDVVCIFTDERVLLDTLKPGQVAASTVGNAYGFHGRPVDPETGLIYMRNRYYDPELGRFLTADPLGYIDGPSMYHYGANDPLNNGDPLGLESMRNFLTPADRAQIEAANERLAALCAVDPLDLKCQNLIAQALILRFGDEANADRARILEAIGTGHNSVLFANGILNDPRGAKRYARETSYWLNRPVTPIWNPTRSGLEDVLQTALVNKLNLPDETTRLVVETVRERLAQLGADESLTLVGHSQGAAVSTSSLSHLSAAERARIDFISIAGASCTFPSGLRSLTVHINTRDIVPMGVGAGAPGCSGLANLYPNASVHYSSFGRLFDFPNTHGVDDYRRSSAATAAGSAAGAEVNRAGDSLSWTLRSTLSRLTSPWFWYGQGGSQ